jgi:SAM-dependent methyltransferase
LRGVYRIRHQDNQVPDTDDPFLHVRAWQQPELVFQLFQQVFVESLSPKLGLCNAIHRSSRRPISTFLEFGCATAPVTTTFAEFFKRREISRAYIADIQTVSFHYAAFKFRLDPRVTPVLLRPDDDFALGVDHELDAICAMTVFEHLLKPLATVERLHDALAPGGLLVFDYLKTDGEGLDTRQGVEQRASVLDFIERRFDIVSGALSRERGMDLTIARKR